MDVALKALSLTTNDWSGVLAKSRGPGKSQPAGPILEQLGELKECFEQR
jgi:hypothetical protein